ncbi:hypothetical protein GS397_06975 [Sphingobium yanoikuyae]|uniref:Uncharacterized protein n=1 Tax=Sphingobium yanoikuyae TaxID=13690 RepID=A0A6P1GEY7_SPHYA|nr:hypothetical protein [Sphingobium yanoikuyae]QHD66812.1 hypothetical protein GS397_06975 [Sphingobium yanoikuyae]
MANEATTTLPEALNEATSNEFARWSSDEANNASVATLPMVSSPAINSEADAAQVVATFRAAFQNDRHSGMNEARTLRLKTRKALYSNIGKFCEIASRLLDPANENHVGLVLNEHGLSFAKGDWNPYGPIAKLLFGEWIAVEYVDDNGKTKSRKVPTQATKKRNREGIKEFFLPDRNAEKYAKVARYAKSKGWNAATVEKQLVTSKGGLNGIVACDTDANRKTDADVLELDQLVEYVKSKPALKELTLIEAGLKPNDASRKVVSLWAEVKDGKVLIRGTMPTSEDAINTYLRKDAKANAAALWKEKAQSRG